MADMTFSRLNQCDSEDIGPDTDCIIIRQLIKRQIFFFRHFCIPDFMFIEKRSVFAAQILNQCPWRPDIKQTMTPGQSFSRFPLQLNRTVRRSADETKHPAVEPVSGAGICAFDYIQNDFACHDITPELNYIVNISHKLIISTVRRKMFSEKEV
jgi:hypothetical protein